MLYVGDHTTLVDNGGNPYVNNILVYNLSSPLEGFERLDIIPSHLMYTEETSREFDIAYAQYILQFRLIELMKIIFPLYDCMDVYLLVYKDNAYFDIVTESILKFIQNRYGILPVVINEATDYNDVVRTQYNTSFSLNGMYNFDIDREIYCKFKAKEAIINGITEFPEGYFY